MSELLRSTIIVLPARNFASFEVSRKKIGAFKKKKKKIRNFENRFRYNVPPPG